MTIIGIIVILISLIILNAFAPLLVTQVDTLKNATVNTTNGSTIATLGDLILPLLVIAIIVTILVYAIPRTQ